MLRALLLLVLLGALAFWQPSGPSWLQAVPGWVFPVLALLPGLYLIIGLARWLRIVLSDLFD